MKVHIWGINYSPEVTGIGPYNVALCEHLAQHGHEVRMVTSFFYYPAWEKLPTEKNLWFRTDRMEGVTVHRCWHYVPKTLSAFRRILHELSFVATSFLRQLTLPAPDVLVVISPPLLLGAAAWLLCLLKGSRFVFHVQDLQPDAAAGLGMLRSGPLLKALRWLEAFAYRKAALVGGITPGMLRAFELKGVPREKLCYFPNGVELPDFWRPPARGAFRKAFGLSASDFLVVYSGNMGRKQGLEVLLRAAARTADRRIQFILCGDGAERRELEKQAQSSGVRNVHLIPLLPEPRYRELLADADLCVIPQQPGSAQCFFPSKLLRALAFSRPILAITDAGSELAASVREGGFGRVVPPEDEAEIARVIETLAANPEELPALGRAGYKFVKRFDQRELLVAFTQELERIALRSSPHSKSGCPLNIAPV